MLGYLVIGTIAFSGGVLAGGVLSAGRRNDLARGGDLLADAVDALASDHDDRRFDVGNRVAVARSRLDQLEQALAVHDELRST
jgi:outer membrane murein-binding lipoprotein Lpp